MAGDRWEESKVPGYEGYVVTRDKYSAGMVSLFKDNKIVASPIGLSDSLAHAQTLAVRHLEGPPPEPVTAVPDQPPPGKGGRSVRISAADALRAGLVTEAFVKLVGPDTMVEVL